MAHKQVRDGYRKTRRDIPFEDDEYEPIPDPRRVMVPSSDDVKRMALESSRAKLIMQIVGKMDENDCTRNEFSSYYRGTSRYADPPYSITSHTNRIVPKKMPEVTTFPSLGVATSESSNTDTVESRKFKCKCQNCKSPNCPSKKGKKKTAFKDNIMTFCDRSTLTPKLANANCGGTPKHSRAECSLNSSMVAVRDTDERMERCYRPPTPILKKPSGQLYYDCGHRRYDDLPEEVYQESESGNEYQSSKHSGSIKCYYKKKKPKSREATFRGSIPRVKNLYNEGISDSIVKQLPVCPRGATHVPLPTESFPDCSGASEVHAPQYNKYHAYCKKPKEMGRIVEKDSDGPARCAVSPRPRLVRARRSPVPVYGTPSIRLPKKVLTSERNIETFINDGQCQQKCKKR